MQTYKQLQEILPKGLCRDIMEYNLPHYVRIESDYAHGLVELTIDDNIHNKILYVKAANIFDTKDMIIWIIKNNAINKYPYSDKFNELIISLIMRDVNLFCQLVHKFFDNLAFRIQINDILNFIHPSVFDDYNNNNHIQVLKYVSGEIDCDTVFIDFWKSVNICDVESLNRFEFNKIVGWLSDPELYEFVDKKTQDSFHTWLLTKHAADIDIEFIRRLNYSFPHTWNIDHLQLVCDVIKNDIYDDSDVAKLLLTMVNIGDVRPLKIIDVLKDTLDISPGRHIGMLIQTRFGRAAIKYSRTNETDEDVTYDIHVYNKIWGYL